MHLLFCSLLPALHKLVFNLLPTSAIGLPAWSFLLLAGGHAERMKTLRINGAAHQGLEAEPKPSRPVLPSHRAACACPVSHTLCSTVMFSASFSRRGPLMEPAWLHCHWRYSLISHLQMSYSTPELWEKCLSQGCFPQHDELK